MRDDLLVCSPVVVSRSYLCLVPMPPRRAVHRSSHGASADEAQECWLDSRNGLFFGLFSRTPGARSASRTLHTRACFDDAFVLADWSGRGAGGWGEGRIRGPISVVIRIPPCALDPALAALFRPARAPCRRLHVLLLLPLLLLSFRPSGFARASRYRLHCLARSAEKLTILGCSPCSSEARLARLTTSRSRALAPAAATSTRLAPLRRRLGHHPARPTVGRVAEPGRPPYRSLHASRVQDLDLTRRSRPLPRRLLWPRPCPRTRPRLRPRTGSRPPPRGTRRSSRWRRNAKP